ncbi:hypothetical protein ACOME3_001997 [Neoechinorhynchus agilis]
MFGFSLKPLPNKPKPSSYYSSPGLGFIPKIRKEYNFHAGKVFVGNWYEEAIGIETAMMLNERLPRNGGASEHTPGILKYGRQCEKNRFLTTYETYFGRSDGPPRDCIGGCHDHSVYEGVDECFNFI